MAWEAISRPSTPIKDHLDEVTIRLAPEKAGTKVELRHSGLAGRPEQYANYQQGWTLILGWLARQYSKLPEH